MSWLQIFDLTRPKRAVLETIAEQSVQQTPAVLVSNAVIPQACIDQPGRHIVDNWGYDYLALSIH